MQSLLGVGKPSQERPGISGEDTGVSEEIAMSAAPEKPKAKVLTMPKREFVELAPAAYVEGIVRILLAEELQESKRR